MSEKELKGAEGKTEEKTTELAKKNNPIPNIITFMRVIGTISLFFVCPMSGLFFIIYTLCGLSDTLDGTIARATGSTSELGAKLDSIADLLFYGVMFVKIFPQLMEILPVWLWVVGVSVLIIRVTSYVTAAIKYRRFASLHTYINKMAGLSVFLTPYFIKVGFGYVYCIVIGIVTGISSIEELLIHLSSKGYSPNRKSILIKE